MTDEALYAALRQADAAGDVEAAQRLADYIRQRNAPKQEPQPPGGSLTDQIGRQLGLTGRYALEGSGNLAGLVSDPFGQYLPGYEKTGTMAARAADVLGLPKPKGGTEEAVAAASKALMASGLTAGAGAAAGFPALAAQPGLQLASAASGAASGDIARQSGVGPTGQTIAGLIGGLAPSGPALASMATKAGLGAGPQVAENIATFSGAGTTPTAGQATQSPVLQAIESTLAKMPGGRGQIAGKAEQQAQEIGAGLQQQADALAPGANPMTAGRAITRGITGEGGFLDRFKETSGKLYDAVDQYIPAATPVNLAATKTTLAKMVNPIPGASATSDVLTNPKLQQIAEAIMADTRNQPGFGALPYEAAKQLRSKVGDMLSDSSLVSDVPTGQLKQLYGALSTDIRETARQDPQAFAAANRADNYYRAGMDRMDKLNNVVNQAGGPEAVFQAAMSGTREGATTINSVLRSLQPDEANVVTSAVIRRMGRANPSAQNDVGDVFSTERFLTNWNGLSPQAKSALFSRGGQDFQKNMDQIANVASNLREGSSVYRNPSGTTGAAAAASTGAAFILSALTGNFGAAAAIGGTVGATNLASRLMTNPTFVNWLGKQTTRPVGALPAQISVLAQQGKDDPDIQQALAQMGQQ